MDKTVKHIKNLTLVFVFLIAYILHPNIYLLIPAALLLLIYIVFQKLYLKILELFSFSIRFAFLKMLQFFLLISYFLIISPLGWIKRIKDKGNDERHSSFVDVNKKYTFKDLENPW